MPTIKAICPGCNRVIVPKGERCARCKERGNRGTSKNRPGLAFYSSAAWKRVRDQRRELNPLCQLCEELDRVTPMWAVDHIIPRSEAPHLELEISNTRSLCEHHHNQRTARDRRR